MSRHITEEHKEKLKNQSKIQPIVQLTITGIFLNEYISISEASRQTKISRTGISNCLSKKHGLHTAGGYLWRYRFDYIDIS
jgi:hypothetical protein